MAEAETVSPANASLEEQLEPPKKRIRTSVAAAKRPLLLYLYSGPYRHDSVSRYLQEHGWDCREVDIEAKTEDDLLDDDVWNTILDQIKRGVYDGYLASPPCGTFSAARTDADFGPKQLRGAEVPEIFGLKELEPRDKEAVKVGNILADRAAEAAEWFADNSKPWAVEQPARREGKPSMFKLPRFVQLANRRQACFTKFSQCRFGQKFKKDTELLGNLELSEWPKECNHPSIEWIVPWNGKIYFGPHPPLKGRQMAIPIGEWDRSMLRSREPGGPFLTKETAHYPGELNRALASAFVHTKIHTVEDKLTDKQPAPQNHSDLPVPKFKVPRVLPTNDADETIGGMKRPYRSIGKVPGLVNLGVQIRNIIESFCKANPQFQQSYLDALGSDCDTSFPGDPNLIDELRTRVSYMMVRNHPDPSSVDLSDINQSPKDTCLKANFIKLWAESARDPGSRLATWLQEGAPGGLTRHPDLDGLFPLVADDEPQMSWELLQTDFESFTNYSGVEENPEAAKAISSYINKGYLSVHESLDSCKAELGGEAPVLSRLGCIVKQKVNEFGQQISKTRIILDAKQSGVTNATDRKYKSELPRIVDAVHDVLSLMSTIKPGETITQMVADITDAFWLIPLHPVERKFFVAKFKGQYLIFRRTAQGSRTAPLTFASIMAMATRFLQSLLLRNHLRESVWQDARIETYVDDPWMAIKGRQAEIEDLTTTILIGWHLMGFPIAYRKAARSRSLKWIGMNIEIHNDAVEVTIPQDKIAEIRTMALEFLSKNIIPDKDLRSFVGKCMSVASVLHVWKPFISQFYAALHTEKAANAPKACTWTSQVRTGLLWILGFLDHNGEATITKRRWDLQEFLGQGVEVCITWDASPWGFGATLTVGGKMTEYIYGSPTDFEVELLHLKIGSSESQQTLECLGGLVAMRHWAGHWQNKQATLSIKNDNVGALVLLGQLGTHSAINNIIAKEAALDIGISSFRPKAAHHIPGITNKTCDYLSRIHQPGHKEDWPKALQSVPRGELVTRHKGWWKSIHPPCLPASKRASTYG